MWVLEIELLEKQEMLLTIEPTLQQVKPLKISNNTVQKKTKVEKN